MLKKIVHCFLWVLFYWLVILGSVNAAWQGDISEGNCGEGVWEINKRLSMLGYNVDDNSLIYDNRTSKAVSIFQKHAGLPITGVVDEITYVYLTEPAVNGNRKKMTKQIVASNNIVQTAIKYRGIPYLFGGQTTAAFDCSGFVQYVFRELGYSLPRTADYQFECGIPIVKSDLRPGDVVFFTTYEPGASHDGIYVGGGQFIAATVSRGVAYCELDDPFWVERYLGARRYL